MTDRHPPLRTPNPPIPQAHAPPWPAAADSAVDVPDAHPRRLDATGAFLYTVGKHSAKETTDDDRCPLGC